MYAIKIPNPDLLRKALRIALEVAYVDLAIYQRENIKSIMNKLPSTDESGYVSFSCDQLIDLYMCMRYFRHSYTFAYVKEELIKELYVLELSILKKQIVS